MSMKEMLNAAKAAKFEVSKLTTEEKNGVLHAYDHETKGLPLAEDFLRRLTGESKLIR